ncbi:holin [Paenibacillus oryzae]|uniref:Holin n=1 Tax=Paenibacillus oryzae TaxID=1844972 RepID=A0A1A5YDJ2_9BACL|nr:CidA/LrgA family holin-like protein [Paenibacillus oryzae]OBR63470.1 holin [Paenibacillus oryzae]
MPVWVKIILQVLLFTLISTAMNALVAWLSLPIPGGILGIAVLFILLKTGIVKLKWLDAGASWLIAEMLLFFVPSAVGVLSYGPLMAHEGLRILLVIICSTVLVMAVAGRIAERMARSKESASL